MARQTVRRPRTRPSGRRPGDIGTRDAILDAALALFAERGYDGASVRAIAADAGVDPALIRHFFGDKETLFTTVVADRTTIPDRIAGSLAGDPASVGRRVTDAYLRVWEAAETRPILLALVRSATTSSRASELLQELLGARLQAYDEAPQDSDRARALALVAAHLFGVVVARHVVGLAALVRIGHDELVELVAPTIQRYLSQV